MKSKFAMTDLGKMRYFLGVEIKQCDSGMENCNKVCSTIVSDNRLMKDENGKTVYATVYRQLIGSLMYLFATRPDLAFSGWTDSDYAGDIDDRKSTSGYVYMYGNGVVSWLYKKQAIVTLSTTEVEYVVAASCACQSVWLRRILEQLKQTQMTGTTIFCDNTSSIKLSKNPVMFGRCKHIDVRYCFLRDLNKDGTVEMSLCSSHDQIADIMTKALKLETFCKLRTRLGMCDLIEVNYLIICL
ncbi:copia-type polyprotein [Trifolium pratense]|uniref:Copia-type polyprotein n=1 Tax=Trifolium pratense TaxID=57577 RepID=A0A2K3LTT3_TRIPR|nr:copia-type polyprotein [Trifolium pratense]